MDSLRILCSNAAASGALNLKGAWEYGGQVVEKLHLKRSAESLVARSTENRTANWILGAVVIIQGVIVFALIVAALLIVRNPQMPSEDLFLCVLTIFSLATPSTPYSRSWPSLKMTLLQLIPL